MTISKKIITFEEHIKAQIEDIGALFEVMEKETTAIAIRKAEQIESLAKQKLALIHKIQLRDIQLSKFEELKTPSDDLKKIISNIQDTLNKCHLLNEANGSALQRAQLSMHKLRNLFQETAGKSEMTYNSEGHASGSRTLGTNLKV